MPRDARLWVTFSIDFPDHPKIFPLSDAAYRCLSEAIILSRKHLLDGLLPRCFALKRWNAEVLAELCSNHPTNPSLLEVENGWIIRDFDQHQTTSTDIENMRQVRKAAGQKGGIASGASRSKQARSKPEANASSKRKQNEPELESREITTEVLNRTSPRTAQKRAERLPENWEPDPDVIAAMRTECPGIDLRAEHRVFVDYWHAKPGREGTKLDWNATWRNWIRRAATTNGSGQGSINGNGHKPNKLRVAVELAAQLRAEEQRQHPRQGELT